MQDSDYSEGQRLEFDGGPLTEPDGGGVHSLIVHLAGDGRFSVGAYIFDRVTRRFVWHAQGGSGDA